MKREKNSKNFWRNKKNEEKDYKFLNICNEIVRKSMDGLQFANHFWWTANPWIRYINGCFLSIRKSIDCSKIWIGFHSSKSYIRHFIFLHWDWKDFCQKRAFVSHFLCTNFVFTLSKCRYWLSRNVFALSKY